MSSLDLQSRESWLQARADGIGASDSSAVFGVNPWKSPFALWLEKTKRAQDTEESERMRIGRKLEPVIAELYSEATGREVTDPGDYAIQKHPDYPWLLCTLDRETKDTERGGGIVELKATNIHRAEEWHDDPPLHYQIQLQHQMAVTGAKWGSLAVLIGGSRFLYFDIDRNEKFIAALIHKCSLFWRHVEEDMPVQPDGSDATSKALALLYPKENGETVNLPAEAAEWDKQLKEIARLQKQLDSRESELKNLIRSSIGEAEYGMIPGGGRWAWKSQESGGYTVERKTIRVLRRLKA